MFLKDQHKRLLFLTGAFGAFTMAAQIVFLREFFVVAGGNELLIGVFFMTWFLGVVAGAFLCSRLSRRIREPRPLTVFLLLFQCALAVGMVFVIRGTRLIFHAPAGEFMPLWKFLAAAFLTLFPFSLLSGFLFPLFCRNLAAHPGEESASIGKIYAWESLGGIIAGLLIAFVIIGRLESISALCLFAIFVSSGAYLVMIRDSLKTAIFCALAVAIFIIAGFGFMNDILEKLSTRLRWESVAPGFDLVDEKNTPYQRLSLARRHGQYSLFSNGQAIASFPDPYDAAEEAQLVMTVCSDPRRIILLGGGDPGLLPEILKHPVQSVTYVEQDPAVLEFIRPYLEQNVRQALKDERVRIAHDDGYRFIMDLAQRRREGRKPTPGYDLIWVGAADPVTAEDNRFFTADFYEKCALLLSERGVLAAQCGGAVNYVGEDVGLYARSIYKSLRSAFSIVESSPGPRLKLFATNAEGARLLDPGLLARRYEKRGVRSDHFGPPLFYSILEPFQKDFINAELKKNLDAVQMNEASHPVTYLNNLKLWARHSESGVSFWFEWIQALRLSYVLGFIGIMTAGMIILQRKGDPARRCARGALYLVTITGACAMTAELLRLYQFQQTSGTLYHMISAFIALFMAGLTLGARLSAGFAVKRVSPKKALDLLIVIDGAYLAFILLSSAWSQTAGHFVVIFGFGLFTGAQFPLAGRAIQRGNVDTGVSAGLLDAGDHAGAAAGAALTGAAFLPALGLKGTLFILVALKLSSLAALLSSRIRGGAV